MIIGKRKKGERGERYQS